MSLRIVRNNIAKMNTEAIVNTASSYPCVGDGCDTAIYEAAGYDELLAYRKDKIGYVPEGEAFITPGFKLDAKYIIHAVSPLYLGGEEDEEIKLRSCYQKSLNLAKEKGIKSISFPLIATGSYGYPKEEGMRIAVDELGAFLLANEMDIYLVVYDDKSNALGKRIFPSLEETGGSGLKDAKQDAGRDTLRGESESLDELLRRRPETFSQRLMQLIADKNMENARVYKRAIVDKKVFSKIKNNPDYHPQKLTALCLCVGAELNIDETADLLRRAGYALSPCDKTDIVFKYFIENGIYDMIDLDIELEELGLPCIIS